MSSSGTVALEEDEDEVVLVRVNAGIVDLTSDQSSDEDCQPPVNIVPKPKVELKKNTGDYSQTVPKKIKHTLINIGKVVVPFIFRGEQQLVEKNLVEELLFFKYFRIFSDELIQCMTPVLFMLTPEEKAYFMELHKQNNLSGAVSNILFVKEDVEKMLSFLDNCHDMLVLKKPKFNICGFVKVLGTLIPFIMHNWFKFMPLFYFENDSELGKKLSKLAATFSNPWVLSYLKMCCKIEGVREQFYLKSNLKLVNLNTLVKNLPDGTRVDIFWPEKITDVVFRPDYLKSITADAQKPDDPTIVSHSTKRQCKGKTFNAKKIKRIVPKKQKVEHTKGSVNDIKVTIENVMTIPEESFHDDDSEFKESSQNHANQNVIVIRANDTVPIQMSLNVGPVNSTQVNANMDDILASHNQVLFNPNLHSLSNCKSNDKTSPILINNQIEQSWSKLQTDYKTPSNLKQIKQSVDLAKTDRCTAIAKPSVSSANHKIVHSLHPTICLNESNDTPQAHKISELTSNSQRILEACRFITTTQTFNNLSTSSSCQEIVETSSLTASIQAQKHSRSISTSQEIIEASRRILNLEEPEFRIKSEIKQENLVEITLDDIHSGSDEYTKDCSPHDSSPVISIASSPGDNSDFDDIVPVSLVAVQPIERNHWPELEIVTHVPICNPNNNESSESKTKRKSKPSVFSSPITALNNQAEPYPVMHTIEQSVMSSVVPVSETNTSLDEPSESVAMVIPKIVNSYSMKEVADESVPSFVKIEGSNGNTPPPVMIINKEETQSILFRVTQLEEDPNSFRDSDYLIRQVHIDGGKFHCINLNPTKFTQWLISVSEIQVKLFDALTTPQDLIRSFFQAGLELFRLNNNQKTSFQLFKDPTVFRYMHGLYVSLDEFDNVYKNLKVSFFENTNNG